MATGTCIVTGGAGFIGCALSYRLLARFSRVLVLDSLHPQVHKTKERPRALAPSAEFILADVTDASAWDAVLADCLPDVVVHLAAETGTGQSLTEASRHANANVLGTTEMLDAFVRRGHTPKHILLSSSRAVYGEGMWRDSQNRAFYPGQRSGDQLAKGEWDFSGARHMPFSAQTTEPRPTSVYGATKLAQEHILEAWARSFGAHLTILRLQNVYGPGQSLTNSYTGVVTLFAQLARRGESIPLYEDGLMLRDFVYIDDVAEAFIAGIEALPPNCVRLDVGTGAALPLFEIAHSLARAYGAPEPHISGNYRLGDVRHASCEISETLSILPWAPRWPAEQGLSALRDWIETQALSAGN